MPDAEKEVFNLLWYQDLTQAEAAALLEVTERVVKYRWRSATQATRKAGRSLARVRIARAWLPLPCRSVASGKPGRQQGASAEEHHEDGLADDPQIPAERPVGDVIQVEPDHLFVIQVAPPADLPGACQAGEHLEALRSPAGPRPAVDRCREAEGGAGRPGSSRP